ncbi:MAG: c-type cytochrome [Steroidobacteraceae bacterium]|jgi:cytochrome c553
MFSRLTCLSLLAGATVLIGSQAALAQADAAADAGKPNPERGQKLFYTCYGCHGVENYRNAYPDYSVPKLRHQNSAYIIAALNEYKSGARPHPTMHAQAESLSDQDIKDIAAYLQGGEPVKPSTEDKGSLPKEAAACAACHGGNGTGVLAPLDPKPPVLAGQHVDYLEQALTAYHNGRRKNVVMNGMAQLLTNEDEIKAVAEYFASQASPLETATTSSE